MALARKVLWIVSMNKVADEESFTAHVKAAGITTVCIRTSSTRLPAAIERFHKLKTEVWAWRWPGVDPSKPIGKGPHYYAPLEAKFVADECIPAGLDGYIVDPESDKAGDINDWNDKKHAPLAKDFCAVIKKAAAGKKFVFGTTSGCAYPAPGGKPNIPWKEFFAASDALYPQTYWRWTNGSNQVKDINGGTPDKAIDRALPAWQPKSMGKPIIPMAGEIDLVTPAEIAAYGARLAKMKITEGHFYADLPVVKANVLDAIKKL